MAVIGGGVEEEFANVDAEEIEPAATVGVGGWIGVGRGVFVDVRGDRAQVEVKDEVVGALISEQRGHYAHRPGVKSERYKQHAPAHPHQGTPPPRARDSLPLPASVRPPRARPLGARAAVAISRSHLNQAARKMRHCASWQQAMLDSRMPDATRPACIIASLSASNGLASKDCSAPGISGADQGCHVHVYDICFS